MKSCKDCQRTTCNATCLSKKMKQDKKKDPDKRKGERQFQTRDVGGKGIGATNTRGKKW